MKFMTSSFVIAPFQLSIEVYTTGKWLLVVHTVLYCYAFCSFQYFAARFSIGNSIKEPDFFTSLVMFKV